MVRYRGPLTGVGEKETAIIQLGREIGRHKVTLETYVRALRLFGETDRVDAVDLMAGYAGTAVNLTAANQWMPPQMKQFLPLPFTMADDNPSRFAEPLLSLHWLYQPIVRANPGLSAYKAR